MRWYILALLASACSTRAVVGGLDSTSAAQPDEDEETGETGEDDGYTPCQEVELDALGPSEPVVGDTWVIWLSCDGARLVGPMVITFDPLDFVQLDDNIAVFQYAGTGTLTVNTGRYRVEAQVTVTEP